jgi:hypothetical protein
MFPASYLGLFCLCLLRPTSNAALKLIELIQHALKKKREASKAIENKTK